MPIPTLTTTKATSATSHEYCSHPTARGSLPRRVQPDRQHGEAHAQRELVEVGRQREQRGVTRISLRGPPARTTTFQASDAAASTASATASARRLRATRRMAHAHSGRKA